MRVKTVLLSVGVIGISVVSYAIGVLLGMSKQIEYLNQYPSRDVVSAFNTDILYVSSLTETIYPQIFEDGMQPAGSPTTYSQTAVVEWLLEEQNTRSFVEKERSPDERMYKATGALTITDTDEDGDMFVHKLSVGEKTIEAYGSVENYSSQIQSVVQNHGFHTIENVTGVFNMLNDGDEAHFLCLVVE